VQAQGAAPRIGDDAVRSRPYAGNSEYPSVLVRVGASLLMFRMSSENPNGADNQQETALENLPSRILRDCTPSPLPIRSGEDTVRPLWRHRERGRNDPALVVSEELTTGVTSVPKVRALSRLRVLPPALVTVRCAAGYMLENPRILHYSFGVTPRSYDQGDARQ
jgi:hypothetical protein